MELNKLSNVKAVVQRSVDCSLSSTAGFVEISAASLAANDDNVLKINEKINET